MLHHKSPTSKSSIRQVRQFDNSGTLEQDLNLLSKVNNLEVFDRFVKLIMDQLSEICSRYDYNQNMVYETE